MRPEFICLYSAHENTFFVACEHIALAYTHSMYTFVYLYCCLCGSLFTCLWVMAYDFVLSIHCRAGIFMPDCFQVEDLCEGAFYGALWFSTVCVC